MTERMIPSRDATICAEAFGNAQHSPLLLIMGACASMLWWPREFCELLAAAEFFVIRYDHRDTGRSTCYEPGTINYSLDDMSDDAIAVMDAYSIDRAVIVGASLGGMIGQLIALKKPERIKDLILLISGPVAVEPDVPLPPIDQKVLDHHARSASIDWSNEEQVIDFSVMGWLVTAGTRHPFDEVLIRSIAREEFHRSKSLLSMFNHGMLSGGEWAMGRLQEIQAPTLLIQGTEDPVLPFPHAEYLARIIPNSRLIALEGVGHEIHRHDWKQIVQEIKAYTGSRQ